MYSMEDAVLDHSRQGISSTGDALKLLGLKDSPENRGAGNLYLTALKIIKKYDLFSKREFGRKIATENKPKRRIEVE